MHGKEYIEDIVNMNIIINYRFILKMLDLDKLDPDWELAANHGKACCPGFLKESNSSGSSEHQCEHIHNSPQRHEFCRCCLRIIDKVPIPLCENTKELQFLGFGFPLYFIFNKYAIILLTLQVISYSILSLYWAVESTKEMCQHGQPKMLHNGEEGFCYSWLIKFMRTQSIISDKENILRVCSFFTQLLGLIYIRDTIFKTLQYYQERNTLISDYAIIFMGLPQEIGSIGKIRDFLQTGFEDRKYGIEEIIVLNSLQEFFEQKKQKFQLIKQKKQWINQSASREKERKLATIDRKIKEKEEQMKSQHLKELQLIKLDHAICDKAIVILTSQDQKNQIIENFNKIEDYVKLQHFGVEGLNITIQRAPQPKQIIWQNINYSNGQRMVRLSFGWLLTAILLTVVTVIFYFILSAKAKGVEHSTNQTATFVTILSMLLITFFNKFILSSILHYITDIQMHRTGSQYQFSFGLKYTLGLFFTTALMTIIVEGYNLHNVYSEKYGVVEEESIMFFFNSFLIPIIWLVHPWQLMHLIKRYYYFGRKDLTQNQANILMQNSRYSVGKKYAQVTESVWFTYLYSSLIPGGAVLITLGFGFFYWVDKCVLLRRSSINPNVNGQLSIRSMKLLNATLIMRCVGELIFDNLIRQSSTWFSVLCLIIAVIYFLLPTDNILKFLHKQTFYAEQKLYKDVKHQFIENYITLNPLFSEELDKALERPTIEKDILHKDFPLKGRSTSQVLSNKKKEQQERQQMRKISL